MAQKSKAKRELKLEHLDESTQAQVKKFVTYRVKSVLASERRAKENDIKIAESFPKINQAIDAACRIYGVDRKDMMGERQYRQLSDARKFVYLWARKNTRLTIEQIARIFNRNHATIIHGCSTMGELITIDKNLSKMWLEFNNSLTNKIYECENIVERANNYTSGKMDVLVHRTND